MDAQQYVTFLQSIYAPSENQLIDLATQIRQWGETRGRQQVDPLLPDIYEQLARAQASGKQIAELQTEYLHEYLLPSVAAVLPAKLVKLLPSIGVGVLPLRTVNASASRTKSGNLVVLVDTGLFSMISFYTECQFLLGPISRAHSMDESVSFITNSYKFIISYYEHSGEMPFPLPKTDIQIPSERFAVVLLICMAAEMFVLCHEFAHIHAGHLINAQPRKLLVPSQPDQPLEILQHDWDHEYEADAIGFEWYIRIVQRNELLRDYGLVSSLLMPFKFFELAALVEANIQNGIDLKTHPPASHRAANLIRYIAINLKNESWFDGLFDGAVEATRIVAQMPKVPH